MTRKKLLLRALIILCFCLWWLVFPVGMIGVYINDMDTDLKMNWIAMWDALAEAWYQ